jgi:Uma2 family endonuclease
MVMPALHDYWTVDMVRALPDDGMRYEVVHGELLVSPGPTLRHQRVSGHFFRRLSDYLDQHGGGHVFYAPASVNHSSRTEVQPDLFVLPANADIDAPRARLGDVLLAIEVLSKSTARYDRFTKRRLFQEVGVAQYWIVDPDARTVEVWTPDAESPVVERERLTWSAPGAPAPLEIPLEAVFAG